MAHDSDTSHSTSGPEPVEPVQGQSSAQIPVVEEPSGVVTSLRGLPAATSTGPNGAPSAAQRANGVNVPVPVGSTSIPDSVGKYHLLARIGEGGMAEVFLAIAHGPANFNKLIALKLLRPNIAADAEHAEMFFEEARLAARLTHPNVVQTYDVGEIDGRYFLAMEYLQGQPLSAMHIRTKAPATDMALRILAEALGGLHYAHELADIDGTPLHLVHRDVSPHNIFVTYDGQVKVLDFGIAKTLSREGAATRTGVVKGKVGYMSPEQVGGEKLDRRTDVFAAGVILWEILANRRMWRDTPDVTIMLRLVNRQLPSLREANPDVPEELERICMRAIAPEPSDRYATAAELQADIEAYLDAKGARIRPREVGQFVASTFADVRAQTDAFIQERQRALRESGELHEARSGPNLGVTLTSTLTPNRAAALPALPVNTTGSGSAPLQAPGKGRGALIAGLVVVLATAGTAVFFAGKRAAAPESHAETIAMAAPTSPPAAAVTTQSASPVAAPTPTAAAPAARVRVRVETTPPGARVMVDNVDLGRAPVQTELPSSDAPRNVRAELAGYAPVAETFVLDKDKAVTLTLRRETAAGRAARAVAAPPTKTAPQAPAHTATATAAPTQTPPAPKKPARQLDNDNPFEK